MPVFHRHLPVENRNHIWVVIDNQSDQILVEGWKEEYCRVSYFSHPARSSKALGEELFIFLALQGRKHFCSGPDIEIARSFEESAIGFSNTSEIQ
ncbi:MAG: hypothetical protein WC045_01785 [Patescibacteria group bacterium]